MRFSIMQQLKSRLWQQRTVYTMSFLIYYVSIDGGDDPKIMDKRRTVRNDIRKT